MGQQPEIDSRGFTLLELILTLLVVAVAVGLVAPAIGRSTEAVRARAEVAGFSATFRHAREQAITTRQQYTVVVNPVSRLQTVMTGEDEVRWTRALSARLTIEAARPGARCTAGFTLLEVLVAFAILSVAVVALIQGFAQGLRLLKVAGDHQQA